MEGTIYEILFELTVSLCERFPAYTPTGIRKTPAKEVFLMIRRLNGYLAKKEKEKSKKEKKGTMVRRPAGDNWV